MGRDWLGRFEVMVHSLQHSNPLEDTLQKHAAVFNQDLGCMKGPKVKLHVDAVYTK